MALIEGQVGETDSTIPSSAREDFKLFAQAALTITGEIQRPTRAGDSTAGFSEAEFQAGQLLEVQFDDGSVFYTDPQSFAEGYGAAGTARSGPTDAGPVHLPFQLPTADGAAVATRGGRSAIPVSRYRLAKLTDPTALDKVYEWGDRLMQRVEAWLGMGSVGPDAKNKGTAKVADSVSEIAGMACFKLCHFYENSILHAALDKADGVLLRWTGSQWSSVSAVGGAAGRDIAEVLLLLHGTASSTEGSFSGLWSVADSAGRTQTRRIAEDWRALSDERRLVLAFDHRSLTVSPVRNVLDLLDQLHQLQLPANCRIHWVSHSRGGLVGELLALAIGPAQDVRARAAIVRHVFERAYESGHPDRPLVLEFLQQIESGERLTGWTPGTFVRVACPARGTLLADRRTDLFLSLLLRSVGLAFGVNGNPWFGPLQGLVRSLVASRADARYIPGLEAMIPGAPLSLALNSVPGAIDGGLTLPGRLRVVAGVSEGFGPGGLASMLGNVFYGLHDHDFVVHTHSMFGGFDRADAKSRLVTHRSVNHFGYFRGGAPAAAASAAAGPHTRQQVLEALRGEDTDFSPLSGDEAGTRGLLQQATFKYSRWQHQQWLDVIRAKNAPRKNILVVLPGIMGSELSYTGKGFDTPVWLSAGSIFNGNLRDLELGGSQTLQATGMLPLAYERLLSKARAQFHVVTFPYDWRQPIPEAAAQLLDLLAQLVPEAERLNVPVHLLAHSMGGLVSRVALWCDDFGLKVRRGDLTARLEARGLRLVQCGTPNRGSYVPIQLLLQQHPLTRNIARAARGVDPAALARFGATYPGLMAMLPDEPDPVYGDLFEASNWDNIAVEESAREDPEPRIIRPDLGVLAEAAKLRAWLRSSFEDLKKNPRVFYVAGHGLTPLGLKRLGGRPKTSTKAAVSGVLRLGLTQSGDGTVPWNSRLVPERTWYANCEHGSLLDEPDAFDGYFELLQQGSTTRLPTAPPALRGLLDENRHVFEVPAPASLASDPVAYVLGLRPPEFRPPQLPPITVRIVHGSLDYAHYPLLAGHYMDDGVYGAVRRIDTKLKGQFTHVLRMGLFDGTALTSVYLRESGVDGHGPAYPGAIVVGLGRLSDLNPAALVDSLTRGVLSHAFEHLHQDAWARGPGDVRIRLSSVLIGAHLQAMSVRESLVALLTGVSRAAAVLSEGGILPRQLVIDEVEIVELHEAVALDAAYALAELMKRPEWQQRYDWPSGVLEMREGGVRGYRPVNESSMWQRLLVQCDPMGSLKFELIAERARVESTQNRADVFSLRQFIAAAADSGATLAARIPEMDEFGRMLFNLLLPQSLKMRLTNFQRTVVMVDDEAAQLPWELLAPPRFRVGGDEAAQPLSVQAGMLRQRLVAEFREDTRPMLRGPRADEGILVVGVPDTRGWVDEQGRPMHFRDLPGAAGEARMVAELFQQKDWPVTRLIRGSEPGEMAEGASCKDVRWQLMRPQPWRVLHLAGHGMFDLWQRNTQTEGASHAVRGSGMVLGEQQMLTAAMVELMDPAPEFVFINCCYSAVDAGVDAWDAGPAPSGQRNLPAIAASLAMAFIRMGSQAVVAAGWQVHDGDGALFAGTLYEGLFAGSNFGEAVLNARRTIWDNGNARSNTWGAYQCYGDPNWHLKTRPNAIGTNGDAGGSGPLADAHRCMSPRELADRIEQITAEAGDNASKYNVQAMNDLIDRLRGDTARQHWLGDSQVLAALGSAWRELGETGRSLDAHFKGMAVAHPQLTLDQIEKAANLMSMVKKRPEGAGSIQIEISPDVAMASSVAALSRIDEMADALRWPGTAAPLPHGVAPSAAHGERACLRGSALSRRARDLPEAKRAAMRLEAAEQYASGYHSFAAHGAAPSKRAYALSNAILMAALAALHSPELRDAATVDLSWWNGTVAAAGGQTPATLDDVLGAIDPVLADLAADTTLDFWGFASFLDLRVARQLMRVATGKLPRHDKNDDLGALERIVETALLRWPSPGQFNSFISRPVLALGELKKSKRPNTAAKALGEALEKLVDHVKAAQRALGD